MAVDFSELFNQRLREVREAGLYRNLSPAVGLSFVNNDYLGLSRNARILAAGREALEVFGAGSTGSRLLGGQSRLFEMAEEEIADFFGAPASLIFSTGYMANLAGIPVLASFCDRVLSDERNHASLIDAIRLSGRPKIIVPHNGWRALRSDSAAGAELIVAESLYSMDGDFADFPALTERIALGSSFLWCDEAHAAGLFQKRGRGLVGESGPDWNRTCLVVTFGKAFGVAGAAILCSQPIRELLINQARAFVYTTAPSPVVVAMVRESLRVVDEADGLRGELWQRAERVREILLGANSPQWEAVSPPKDLWEARSPIIAFHIPGERNALRFSENMRESGIELRAIRYPTVAKGRERLRISLNLAISRSNTESMAEEVVKRWKAFSLQP